MDNNTSSTELSEKLLAGVKLAFQRLVEKARLNDDYLIFSENGKVVKVKARYLNNFQD
jgi:hypothetical protein